MGCSLWANVVDFAQQILDPVRINAQQVFEQLDAPGTVLFAKPRHDDGQVVELIGVQHLASVVWPILIFKAFEYHSGRTLVMAYQET